MRVRHLNCGTMRPPRTPEGLVCHVLLLETATGLALVDSGLGLRDIAEPHRRFGPARYYVRPAYDQTETAIRQIHALGYDPRDVRHIVLTHFDADHVGGLSDFPWANVHVTATEATAARHPTSLLEKSRYKPAQRDHHPNLVTHTPRDGETWHGFAAAQELTDVAPGVVLISLPGHTRGHAAVAVDTGQQQILHVGDSFYHHAQLDGSGKAPLALTAMERLVAYDWRQVQTNHERLRELWNNPQPGLLLVNAHDPALLKRATESARTAQDDTDH